MTGEFGLSFAPTSQNEAQNAQQATPIQDAIKVLSLRIPQFVGAKSIAPGALLNGMGGAGLGGGTPGGLEQWLAQLFGQMGGAGQAPTPNFIPGEGGPKQLLGPRDEFGGGDGAMVGGQVNPGSFTPGGGGQGPRMPSFSPGGPRPPRNPFGGGPRMPNY